MLASFPNPDSSEATLPVPSSKLQPPTRPWGIVVEVVDEVELVEEVEVELEVDDEVDVELDDEDEVVVLRDVDVVDGTAAVVDEDDELVVEVDVVGVAPPPTGAFMSAAISAALSARWYTRTSSMSPMNPSSG